MEVHFVLPFLGEPEVSDFQYIIVNENVLGFEVSVHYPILQELHEPSADLFEKPNSLCLCHLSSLFHVLPEFSSVA